MTTPPFGPPGQPNQYPPGQPGGGFQPAGQIQPGYNPYAQGPSGQGGGYRFALPGQPAGYTTRVGASIIDGLLQGWPMGVGILVLIATSTEHPETGSLAMTVASFASLAIWILNRIVQQGRTGQSLGKKITGTRVVSLKTGELIGFGPNLGREICAYFFNYICFLNLLWPLWDEKQQTWHDKVVDDIVIST
ncbi:RDD family protein [Kribbella antibiotica]|uniref:RDD family protein n=1 Tax=Kribbella antibiotica TaxID=190195 RepID=A0A4R4ZG23_9ACTN|nr:RDD family protein [Kribbella antibiotica]TDD57453.1 RDD family protein [Kribbella antibiotica]